jgi:DNA-binding transcriptional MerR regulator
MLKLKVNFKSSIYLEDKNTMMIGELAARAGVPASTIRYWEHVGILPGPPRAQADSDDIRARRFICLRL